MTRRLVQNYSEFHDTNSKVAAGGRLALIGNGERIEEGDSLETIAKKAGLNFNVEPSPSLYRANDGKLREIPNRVTLFRSDNGAALDMVSANKYKVRQPMEILETFSELLRTGGFNIEAAGSIQSGKKIWAYARRKDEAFDLNGELIGVGLMCFDSYDGTLATCARQDSLAFACNNVLSTAHSRSKNADAIKRRHSQEWDIADVMAHLERYNEGFATFMETARMLANIRMTELLRRKFFARVYAPEALTNPNVRWDRSGLDFDREVNGKALVTTNAKNVIEELESIANDSPGSDMPSRKGTAWGALNAITFYQDHLARTKGNLRFESATVGQGKRIKDSAFETILELA